MAEDIVKQLKLLLDIEPKDVTFLQSKTFSLSILKTRSNASKLLILIMTELQNNNFNPETNIIDINLQAYYNLIGNKNLKRLRDYIKELNSAEMRIPVPEEFKSGDGEYAYTYGVIQTLYFGKRTIQLRLNPDMVNALMDLKDYSQINYSELLKLKSKYGLWLYLFLKFKMNHIKLHDNTFFNFHLNVDEFAVKCNLVMFEEYYNNKEILVHKIKLDENSKITKTVPNKQINRHILDAIDDINNNTDFLKILNVRKKHYKKTVTDFIIDIVDQKYIEPGVKVDYENLKIIYKGAWRHEAIDKMSKLNLKEHEIVNYFKAFKVPTDSKSFLFRLNERFKDKGVNRVKNKAGYFKKAFNEYTKGMKL